MRQVITIGPDGSIHGLQHKRGQGLDLRKMGKAKIERVTLIEWDERHQAWFIKWAVSGDTWRLMDFQPAWPAYDLEPMIVSGQVKLIGCCNEARKVPMFNEYDDAVAAEVAVIQALQITGQYKPHAA